VPEPNAYGYSRNRFRNVAAVKLDDLLSAVQNDRIQFVTMRPPGSPFVLLERRVVVVAPPEVEQLIARGDPHLLEELIPLLQDPQRAWAAEVILAAVTRQEEKMVDTYATNPDQWWDLLGRTAYERWSQWLADTRGRLTWDATNQVFVETD
jgi:hypothetical protein